MSRLQSLDSLEPEELLFLAQIAGIADRHEGTIYADSVTYMTVFVNKAENELGEEERSALSVGFKYVVGIRRASWRVLSSLEKKETRKGNHDSAARVSAFKQEVEQELLHYCSTALSLVDRLLPRCTFQPAAVLYYKMKGDYHRYMCEISREERWREAARTAYAQGLAHAHTHLSAGDTLRLGIALNSAVFEFEIMGERESACRFAREARDAARSLPLDKEALGLVQLLADNLSLWSSSAQMEDSGS